MSGSSPTKGFPGIPGILNSTNQPSCTDPATPSSDTSESDFLSPSAIASSGKKFWNESSTWIASRINYQSQSVSSSSGYSSVDRPVSISGQGHACKFYCFLLMFPLHWYFRFRVHYIIIIIIISIIIFISSKCMALYCREDYIGIVHYIS